MRIISAYFHARAVLLQSLRRTTPPDARSSPRIPPLYSAAARTSPASSLASARNSAFECLVVRLSGHQVFLPSFHVPILLAIIVVRCVARESWGRRALAGRASCPAHRRQMGGRVQLRVLNTELERTAHMKRMHDVLAEAPHLVLACCTDWA